MILVADSLVWSNISCGCFIPLHKATFINGNLYQRILKDKVIISILESNLNCTRYAWGHKYFSNSVLTSF